MPRIVSLRIKIDQLEGLLSTRDLNEREDKFITDMAAGVKRRGNTAWLSEKQIDWLERLWDKHFA